VELLPALAEGLPGAKLLVLVANAGLDPAEVAGLQALRLGQGEAWQVLKRAAASERPDALIVQGRTLRYWRSLLGWPVAEPLLGSPLPILHAWGSKDALIPDEAYARFATRAASRQPAYCPLRVEGADHGLQSRNAVDEPIDRLPQVWARIERWARGGDWCDIDVPAGSN
jgi:hypothetical protein